MEVPEASGLRPVPFPTAAQRAASENLKAGPETPDPMEWRYGAQPATPMRPIEEANALQLRSERVADQLPCPLVPAGAAPGAPSVRTRTCMRCWMAFGPLFCKECSMYFCGPCAGKAHLSPNTKHHKVGTAARVELVDIHLSRQQIERLHGDSFSLDFNPAAARGMQCPLHSEQPARYACLDCRCEILCSQCYTDGLHKDHNLVNIRTEVPSARVKLMDQYTKLRQQAQSLQSVIASVKTIQGKATKLQNSNFTQIVEAFDAVVRALDEREEAANREVEVVRTLGAQSLRSLDGDCQTFLRYLRVKRRQLRQLRKLGSDNSVVAINAYVDVAPTVAAIEQNTDILEDMRERLRVPHWQLKVMEIDSLLQERQAALVTFSGRVNTYCETATQAVDEFIALELPLKGPPAEHQETKELEEAAESKRVLPAVFYARGMDPYSERFLRKSPDLFQAFVRKDQLHPEWEIRMVSLRGPYLCVHKSDENPDAPIESALVLGRNTFARLFGDANCTAIASLAKKDYPNGIEIVTVNLKAKELQGFLLLAADGQQLAKEWVEEIEARCMENMGLEPEAPIHNPGLSLEELEVEAAGIPFAVPHRRKAAMLPADLLGLEPEVSIDSSWESSSDSDSTSSSVSSSDSFKKRRSRDSSSDSSLTDLNSDSEEAREGILDRIAVPSRPPMQGTETRPWEHDDTPMPTYRRRDRRSTVLQSSPEYGENGSEEDGNQDAYNTGDSSHGRRTSRNRSHSHGRRYSKKERDEQIRTVARSLRKGGTMSHISMLMEDDSDVPIGRVAQIVNELQAKLRKAKMRREFRHRSSFPGPHSQAATPEMGTLEFIPTPEQQTADGAACDKAQSSKDGEDSNNASSNGRDSGSTLTKGPQQRAFEEEPHHGDSPPVQRQRQQPGGSSQEIRRGRAAVHAGTKADSRAPRGTMLNGFEPKARLHALSSMRKESFASKPSPLLRLTTVAETAQSPSSPPLQSRFSYTSGLQTPSMRQRRQGDSRAWDDQADFLKLKMPPKRSLPEFVLPEESSSRSASPAAVSTEAETLPVGVSRLVSPERNTVEKAAPKASRVTAAIPVSTTAIARDRPRLFSTPALPLPPGTARLVARGAVGGAQGRDEALLVERMLQQIGSLKISSSAGAPRLTRSNTTGTSETEN